MTSVDLALIVTAFLVSAGITGLMMVYARRANLLDVPNERSSHKVPTPRGGGLAIVIVVLSAVALLFAFGQVPDNVFFAMFIGGAIVAAIGFVDDHSDVPAKWRFLVQILAAGIAVFAIGGLPAIQVGGRILELGLIGDLVAVVFAVWLINLYNFMDGIDGIAAVESICIVGAAAILIAANDAGFVGSLFAVFVSAVIGFLIWNWPPAKIFMGDVASGFIGFILAVFALVASGLDMLAIWVWLILAGVFIVDATYTLLTRALIGEKWYLPHRNHAYQKASRLLGAHTPVTLAVLLINTAWLLPIAWCASLRPEFGWWLTLLGWAPLLCLAVVLKAGRC